MPECDSSPDALPPAPLWRRAWTVLLCACAVWLSLQATRQHWRRLEVLVDTPFGLVTLGDSLYTRGVVRQAVSRLPPEKRAFFPIPRYDEEPYDLTRVIWERDPHNLVHLNGYLLDLIHALAFEAEGDLSDETKGVLAEVERVARHGMTLEPENAQYDFALSWVCVVEALRYDDPGLLPYGLSVVDRTRWDQAREHFRRGCAKPVLRTYVGENLGLQLGLLPPPRSLVDQAVHLGVGDIRCPFVLTYVFHRSLVEVFLGKAPEWLLAEGDAEGAKSQFLLGKPFARLLASDMRSYSEILTFLTLSVTHREHLDLQEDEDLVRRAGLAEAATEMDAVTFPARTFHGYIFRVPSTVEEQCLKHAGGLAQYNGGIYARDRWPDRILAPSRIAERRATERALLVGWALLLLAPAALLVLVTLMHRGGFRDPPLPRRSMLAPWETLGIALAGGGGPLVLYTLYSRSTGWPGQEYSISFAWPLLLAEALLLMVSVFLLQFFFVHRDLSKHCAEAGDRGFSTPCLGLSVDPGRVAVLVGALWIGMTKLRFPLEWYDAPVLGVGVCGLLLLVIVMFRFLPLMVLCYRHVLWSRAMLAGCAEVCAWTVLLIVFVALPWVQWEEARAVQADTLVTPRPWHYGMTEQEAKSIQRLRQQTLAAIEKLDATGETAP